MGQEAVRIDGDRPLQMLLGAGVVAALVVDDAAVDEALVVVRLDLQHAGEVAQGGLAVGLVEVGLAEEVGELVVAAVELVGGLQGAHGALDVEGEEGVLGVLQVLEEELPLVAVVEAGDALLGGQEALALLQGQELVVHLGLPELAPLVPADVLLGLQQLAQGGEAGLVDEDVLLLLVQGAEELADGLGRALDRLLQDRDPLEQVLVEGEALLAALLVGLLLLAQGAREHQELLVAADAELVIVPVGCSTDLAVHPRPTFLPRTRRSRGPTCGPAGRRRPS